MTLPAEVRAEIERVLREERWEDDEQVTRAFERVALLAMRETVLELQQRFSALYNERSRDDDLGRGIALCEHECRTYAARLSNENTKGG